MQSSHTYANPYTVADQPENVRAAFIRATYAHVAGAIAALVLLEALLFRIPGIEHTVFSFLAKSPYMWLMVLGAFMVVSHFAHKWARSDTSKNTQYMGLAVYTVAEALLLLPLLLMAQRAVGGNTLIIQAAGVTIAVFLAITFIAFTTRKDFSFLGGMLKIGFFIAMGLIVVAIFFPNFLNLGLWFSIAMVVLASGSILYNTSNIIHHYRTDQYVAAALGLFASVALLFWYVLRIFMSSRD